MKNVIFKGLGTAIVTPFDDNGINFKELEKFIEFQISEGVDAIIVCGTTGESSTMTLEEKKNTIKFTIDVVHKRIPVIAGTGGNNTKSVIELSKYAEQSGADGLLIVTPYYNKTTQSGIIAHYKAIASSVSIPIIIYNVPGRTGLNIKPETCLELSKIENIVGIKEASGDISQVANIISLCKDNLNVYSGNDDQVIPILSLGGIGVISVLSNISPKKFNSMIKAFFNRNIYEASKLQIESIPLINSLFSETNPIPVKKALNLMGFNFGIPRLPLIPLSNENLKVLEKNMKNYGIIN